MSRVSSVVPTARGAFVLTDGTLAVVHETATGLEAFTPRSNAVLPVDSLEWATRDGQVVRASEVGSESPWSYTTFRQLLVGRCIAMRLNSQAALRRELQRHGLELSHETVSRWFRGTCLPRGADLEVLLGVLGISDVGQRERAHRMTFAPDARGLRPVVAL